MSKIAEVKILVKSPLYSLQEADRHKSFANKKVIHLIFHSVLMLEVSMINISCACRPFTRVFSDEVFAEEEKIWLWQY